MKKLSVLVAALVAVPMFAFASPVFADSPGQLASGPDLYQVKNVTKNTSYGSSTTVACNETVKFSIKLANSEFGQLTNVMVKAPLNGTMTASATNAANQNTSVSGKVTVTVANGGSLVYVPGSTVNLDVNGNVIKTLPDGITTNGVNKGELKGSTREFVQFQAKVKCDQQPPKECKPGIPEGDKRCEETPVTPETPTTPQTPEVLPNTGTGELIGLFAAIALAGAIAHRVVYARR